ncbi:MAG: hypothetical protein V4498_08150 [candidate division FCPU426 bacterium]
MKRWILASALGLSLGFGPSALMACGADKADKNDVKAEGKSCSHDKAACAHDKKNTTAKKDKKDVSEKVAEKKSSADKAEL